jgi:hypothetical protein
LAELAELGYDVRQAFSEGRDVGAHLRLRRDAAVNKQVDEGVAAATLLSAV